MSPPNPSGDQDIWNWARTLRIGSGTSVVRPKDEEEVQHIVKHCKSVIKIIGSRLSQGVFVNLDQQNGTILDLASMRGILSSTSDTATFAAATTLDEVYQTLTSMGRMLPCSPGVIGMQTLAGAIATGTHGQGLKQSSLSDIVVSFRVVVSDGRILNFDREHPYFGAMQLALGALGVIVEVTLQTIPLRIFTCMKYAVDSAILEECLIEWNQNFSFVKAWWFLESDQAHIWMAREATQSEEELYHQNEKNLIELSKISSALNGTISKALYKMEDDTRDPNRLGDQFKTLTRFKNFADVTGDIHQIFCKGIAVAQMNLEIAVSFDKTRQILKKIKNWFATKRPRMHYPIILRCTGPSSAWLSPAYGDTVCYLGFVVYYSSDGLISQEGVQVLNEMQTLLAAEGGRPHWGKYFDKNLYHWSSLYPRWNDFRQIKNSLDPHRKFETVLIQNLFKEAVTH